MISIFEYSYQPVFKLMGGANELLPVNQPVFTHFLDGVTNDPVKYGSSLSLAHLCGPVQCLV